MFDTDEVDHAATQPSPYQRILNLDYPPSAGRVPLRDYIPVEVRLVWSLDGEEWRRSSANGWTITHVRVLRTTGARWRTSSGLPPPTSDEPTCPTGRARKTADSRGGAQREPDSPQSCFATAQSSRVWAAAEVHCLCSKATRVSPD